MTTAAEMIAIVLRDSGVLGQGQTAQPQDTTDCLRRWNMMLHQWSQRRWLVYHLIDTGFQCTGAQSYTVAPGGNFNITRPAQIEAAYLRQNVPSQPTPVDFPLMQIMSREEYSQIAVKTLAASPGEYFWYDAGFPTGSVYPWPLPNNQYELHILTKAVLQQIATVGDTILLPPEYEEAVYSNLINRTRAAYTLPPNPYFIGMGKASLNTIRRSNFQVGRLNMPLGVTRGPAYNIYSDQGN